MALVKYNPSRFSPIGFNSFVDRFFNDEFHGGSSVSKFSPSVDVAETDKAFEIDFHLPGVKKDDIKIDLKDNRLTVSGERKFKNEKSDKNYKSVESYYGSFSRSFYLPENISEDKVSAAYEDGVLKVLVPKDEKKIAERTISIK